MKQTNKKGIALFSGVFGCRFSYIAGFIFLVVLLVFSSSMHDEEMEVLCLLLYNMNYVCVFIILFKW